MYQKFQPKQKQAKAKATIVKAVASSKVEPVTTKTKEDTSKAKKNKKSVDYSKGMYNANCGICEHFVEPDQCTKVKGDVSFDMWCELFEPKEKSTDDKDRP